MFYVTATMPRAAISVSHVSDNSFLHIDNTDLYLKYSVLSIYLFAGQKLNNIIIISRNL